MVKDDVKYGPCKLKKKKKNCSLITYSLIYEPRKNPFFFIQDRITTLKICITIYGRGTLFTFKSRFLVYWQSHDCIKKIFSSTLVCGDFVYSNNMQKLTSPRVLIYKLDSIKRSNCMSEPILYVLLNNRSIITILFPKRFFPAKFSHTEARW